MQHKTKKIWLIALLSLLIAALFAASFTYARYYKETGVTGGKYDDTIEFVGANKYIVYTPEELVAAIENGYSYIEIAESVEDPFIITDGVTDVSANLVLDINGHNLVRNSRNPLIDVQENVSVVIVYDSKASGSFYNPVGSLLQASGGTLTIATGNFTSGPKAEDYVKDDRTTDKGVSYSLEKYTVYYRDGYTPGATSPNRSAEYIDTGVEADLPKIVPVGIDSEAEDRYGNIYFENGIGDNDYIKDDTFLIYTEETVETPEKETVETPEDATVTVDFSPLCDVASCDFYYYYEKSTEGSGEDKTTTYAVIYGYHDVMKGAEQQITKTGFNTSGSINNNSAEAVIWPYAAVRMTEGEAFIRGGTYTNRFGTAQSYGIYARGGSLSVQGENTSFTSVADGVCIRCTTEGGSAPALHIENGSFTSYNGDTVQVNSGTMTVNSGTFTKSGDSTDNSTKTAIIHMTGGALTAAGSADASGKKSIQMTCAASAGGSTLSNVFGVYSEGGTVSLQNAEISVNGTDSACVLAEQAGSKVDLQSVSINLSGAQSDGKITSAAVNTLGGSITLSGSNQITSDGFGITAAADVSITGGETAVGSEEATLPTTAIYVFGGSLSVSTGATLSVHAEIDENLKWAGYEESTNAYQYDGVQVNGGSLLVYGALNVAFTGLENDNSGDYSSQQIKSYAVRVEAASGGETKVIIASGNITNSVGGGIYVGGGEVTLGDSENNSGPNVKTEGKLLYASVTNPDWSWQQPTYEWKYVVNNSWKYMLNRSGGHAVEVSGGSLTVHGGSYSAQQGNGILIRNTSGSQIPNQVTINSGSFIGYNSGYYISYNNEYDETPLGGDRMVGPAASYGLNVMGHDLTVTINGGSFGETGETGNSAASFFGTSGGVKADVNVYGGTFNATNADAISIFRYIDIMFDGTAISSNIGGTADVASLSVQDDLLYTNDPDRGSTITLENGTFTGTAYGVWYACGYDQLNISGNATINGKVGVQVASAPKTEKGIYISGGTIEGSTDGIYYNAGYGVSASIGGEGYGLNITGGTIRGTAKGNGHALNIAVQPRRHAISISGGELYGGRDTVYVSNADGDEDAVSISGGTFTGAVADVEGSRDYGCAVWFNSGMNNSVYQFTGGTFITKNDGSAIYTSNPGGHDLSQIIPDGYSIRDQNGNSFGRNWKFDTTLNGKHWLTVERDN